MWAFTRSQGGLRSRQRPPGRRVDPRSEEAPVERPASGAPAVEGDGHRCRSPGRLAGGPCSSVGLSRRRTSPGTVAHPLDVTGPAEDGPGRADHRINHLGQGDAVPLGRHRGDRHVGDATGDDVVEHREVGVHIEGEAVGGPTLRDADADGADLPRSRPPGTTWLVEAHPHAGVARESSHRGGGDPQGDEGIDDDLLHPSHVGGPVLGPGAHGEQGVADQLAGSVVGDVTAAVDPDHLDSHRCRFDQHMIDVAVGAEGVHGRVLQQQQVVLDRAPADRPLQGPRLPVRDASQPAHPHR